MVKLFNRNSIDLKQSNFEFQTQYSKIQKDRIELSQTKINFDDVMADRI